MLVPQTYPDEELPEFKPVMVRLYEEYLTLAKKLMEVMAHALKLDVRAIITAPKCYCYGHCQGVFNLPLTGS